MDENAALMERVGKEFRAPLTLVLGPIEKLIGRRDLPPDALATLEGVHASAMRMLRLVESARTLSRADKGELRPRLEQVDLELRTHALLDGFAPAFQAGGVSLDRRVSPTGKVYCDPDMWDKIVLNLVSNALKFTFEGKVEVDLDLDGDFIRLVVSDTGVGMEQDAVDGLFAGYHVSPSASGEGMGMGLAVVDAVVSAMSGRLNMRSQVGAGSTVTVMLPRRQTITQGVPLARPAKERDVVRPYLDEILRQTRDGGPADDSDMRLRRVTRSGVPVVVHVDPDAGRREYIERVLSPYHQIFQVDAVPGLDALLAKDVLPDLVICDVTDVTVRKRLADDARFSDLPILLIWDRTGREPEVLPSAGRIDYVVEPFSGPELVTRVGNLLEMGRLRRESASILRQAQRMETLGHLTGGISHDFSNLLVAILGCLNVIERRVSDPELLRIVSNARRAAERGTRLTRHLVAFSRKDGGPAQEINANDVIVAMGEMLTRTLGGLIAVSTNLSARPWTIRVDASRLELAILNLALNARDAMPEGGEVRIATENLVDQAPVEGLPCGDYVQITVVDTGVGMDAETMRSATRAFFTTGEGTGLGLTEVEAMVREAGGHLAIESGSSGGTRVSLYLPRVEDVPVAPPAPELAEGVLRILLVDDDIGVREATALMLEELGHRVRTADGGRAALALLDAETYDVMVVDYKMPDMLGTEVASRARGLQPDLHVLFATGYADMAALDARDEIILRKPFDIDGLADKLLHAMSVREKRVERRRENVVRIRR